MYTATAPTSLPQELCVYSTRAGQDEIIVLILVLNSLSLVAGVDYSADGTEYVGRT